MQNLTRAVATVGSQHSSSWPGSGFGGQWGAAGARVPADGDIDSMMKLTLVRGGWGNPNPGFDLAADENGVHMAPQPPTSRLIGQSLLPPGSGAICRRLRIQCTGMLAVQDMMDDPGRGDVGIWASQILTLRACALLAVVCSHCRGGRLVLGKLAAASSTRVSRATGETANGAATTGGHSFCCVRCMHCYEIWFS